LDAGIIALAAAVMRMESALAAVQRGRLARKMPVSAKIMASLYATEYAVLQVQNA
jgi:hypothetical protein